jgi:hypothetical protein
MAKELIVNCETGETELVDYLPAPPAVPQIVSDRQFFQQLALLGHISQAEALDAVGPGILPASMIALIGQLPSEHQFAAQITLTGATSFERTHPLTDVLGGMYGMDSAALDQLWRDASVL